MQTEIIHQEECIKLLDGMVPNPPAERKNAKSTRSVEGLASIQADGEGRASTPKIIKVPNASIEKTKTMLGSKGRK